MDALTDKPEWFEIFYSIPKKSFTIFVDKIKNDVIDVFTSNRLTSPNISRILTDMRRKKESYFNIPSNMGNLNNRKYDVNRTEQLKYYYSNVGGRTRRYRKGKRVITKRVRLAKVTKRYKRYKNKSKNQKRR